MIKKIIILIFLLSVIMLSSCQGEEPIVDTEVVKEELQEEIQEIVEEQIEEVVNDSLESVEEEVEEQIEEVLEELVQVEEIEEDEGCSTKADCAWDQHCINNECGKMVEVYDTESECEEKCNFDDVVIKTSDGDELTLSRGKGSYTAAGALEWSLMSSADYCKGEEDTLVAVKLKKKTFGEIVEEEVITLEVDEESDPIKHPDIERIEFTLEVESIDETCS